MTELITTADSPWWARALDRFGAPTVALLMLLGAIGAATRWIAVEVAKPLTSTHIQFVNSVSENVTKQTAVLETIAAHMAATNRLLSEQEQILRENQAIMRAGVQ